MATADATPRAARSRRSPVLGIVALVCGVLAPVLAYSPWFVPLLQNTRWTGPVLGIAPILGIAAVVFGVAGWIVRRGAALAAAGLALGLVNTLPVVLNLLFIPSFWMVPFS